MFPRSRSGSPTPIFHLLCALRATARSSLKPPCEPALVKSPCSAALGDRRSPAEAGLSGGGDPNDAKLEPPSRVLGGLGGAPEADGVITRCERTEPVGKAVAASLGSSVSLSYAMGWQDEQGPQNPIHSHLVRARGDIAARGPCLHGGDRLARRGTRCRPRRDIRKAFRSGRRLHVMRAARSG